MAITAQGEGASHTSDPQEKAATAGDHPSSTTNVYPTGWKLGINVTTLMVGTALMSLDTTIVTIVTPQISTEFHSLADVGWYGAAYLMLLTACSPISSTFYNLYHPRSVYLICIVIFEIGSIVCAIAPSSPAFIAGRAITGVGAAGILQGAFGILTYICPLEVRALLLAVVVSLFGLFGAIGPVIGGAVTRHLSWRWCFWINPPIGAAVFLAAAFLMELVGIDDRARKAALSDKWRSFDIPGVVLLLASVTCLFLALQEASGVTGWSSATPIGLFVGFVALFVVFILWQWRAGENATVPLRFFRDRTVSFGSLYLFWDNMASYVAIYFLPYYFQAARGASPYQSGINYMALAFPQMFGLLAGGAITTATGEFLPVMLFSQFMCAIAVGFLTTLSLTTSMVVWATLFVFAGLGLGLGVNVPHVAIQAAMRTDGDIFIANGIASFCGQLGGAVGVPVANAILLSGLVRGVPEVSAIEPSTEAYVAAVADVMKLLTAIICISVPTALGMKWFNINKVARERAGSTGPKTNEQSRV